MNPDDEEALDWARFTHGLSERVGDRLPLGELQPGDVFTIETVNTRYLFRVIQEREVELVTDRADRPGGRVRIAGCTFGLSSTIMPHELFCGGNLEFNFEENGQRITHTTTTIRKIMVRREGAPAEGSA